MSKELRVIETRNSNGIFSYSTVYGNTRDISYAYPYPYGMIDFLGSEYREAFGLCEVSRKHGIINLCKRLKKHYSEHPNFASDNLWVFGKTKRFSASKKKHTVYPVSYVEITDSENGDFYIENEQHLLIEADSFEDAVSTLIQNRVDLAGARKLVPGIYEITRDKRYIGNKRIFVMLTVCKEIVAENGSHVYESVGFIGDFSLYDLEDGEIFDSYKEDCIRYPLRRCL